MCRALDLVIKLFPLRRRLSVGTHYYLNVRTKESQWDLPKAADISAEPTSTTDAGSAAAGPTKVQCAHLLVKHNRSRRPSSWREEVITRSRDEAMKILEGYAKQVWVYLFYRY